MGGTRVQKIMRLRPESKYTGEVQLVLTVGTLIGWMMIIRVVAAGNQGIRFYPEMSWKF